MKDDDFIGRLVEETYNYLGSEEIPADFGRFLQGQNIKRYPADDNHLFRFLNTQNCEFTHIQYNAQTGCFRLKVAEQALDIPSNWSFFSRLYKFCVSEDSVVYEIDEAEFESCLASLFGRSLKTMFFVVRGRPYFIGSAENHDFIKAWLYKYLEGEVEAVQGTSKAA